jgi:flagellar biosynthesis GTPase FlhF
MSSVSKKRSREAAENNVRTLSKTLGQDLYAAVSPEMAEAFKTFDELGSLHGCFCGNENQQRYFMGCPHHLVCEVCAPVESKVADRRGNCIVPGCASCVTFPCIELPAVAAMKFGIKDTTMQFNHALELEKIKDDEGTKRRKKILAARARRNGNTESDDELEPEPEPEPELKIFSKKKKKKVQTDEEKAAAAAKRKEQRQRKQAKEDEFLRLQDENEDYKKKVRSDEKDIERMQVEIEETQRKLENSKKKRETYRDRLQKLFDFVKSKNIPEEEIFAAVGMTDR